MGKTYTIYVLTNRTNGKRYVGQTEQRLERRWSCHLHRAKFGYMTYLSRAIRKHGPEVFDKRVIIKVPTRELADYFEKSWIFLFNTLDREFGYNLAEGGSGGTRGPEAHDKQRQKMLGRRATPESKSRVSESLKQAWATGVHTGNRGKKLPKSHGEAVRHRMLGKNHFAYRQDVSSKEIYELWKSGWKSKDIQAKFSIGEDTVRRRIKAYKNSI